MLSSIELTEVLSNSTDTITAVFTVVGSPESSNLGQGSPGHGGVMQHHPPRNIPGIDCGGPLPTYAGGCNDAIRYSSACSCLGITQKKRY